MIFLSVGVMWLLSQNILAHSGGTNRDGCHRNHSAGDYHCHIERSPGAYEKQMKGYGKSKSASWFWILVAVGVAFGFIQWIGIGDEKKNDLPSKGGGIRESESKSAEASGVKEQDSQCPKLNECVKEESPAVAGDLDRVSRAASVPKIYNIRCDLSVFDEHELDILETYGVWMSELSRGEREPITKEQQEFVVVCREFRVSSPEKMRKLLSDYEHALGDVQKVWLKYLFRLKVEGKTD